MSVNIRNRIGAGGLAEQSQLARRRALAIGRCQEALQSAVEAIADVDSLVRAVDCVLALGAAQSIISEDDHADLAFIVGEFSERNWSALEPYCMPDFAEEGAGR